MDGTCLDCPEGDVYTTRNLSGRSSGGVQVTRKDWWVTSDVTRLVEASGGPPVWCKKPKQNKDRKRGQAFKPYLVPFQH